MTAFGIRPESPTDTDQITTVTTEAFRSAPHTDHTEHLIVLALRRAAALSVSLVADVSGQVVGHVACSPVQISDASPHWYGLGPVSVLPGRQNQGIGTALVHAALDALRSLGAAGCVVLGDPGYYGRFGFRSGQGCEYGEAPPEFFQSLSFGGGSPRGTVTYHEAFGARS